MTAPVAERRRMRVSGIVQGVGFRPFVYGLARDLGLSGVVGNDAQGVFVEVEGPAASLDAFEARVRRDAPPLAVVDDLTSAAIPARGDTGFTIVVSPSAGAARTLVSPDVATCADCLREVLDPSDRRFRYPFTNCTSCGPRFTITKRVPYDRVSTTMARFAMCAACAAEYADPSDRRFHAQPVCCPTCGPRLVLTDPTGAPCSGDALAEGAAALRGGAVLAVKGLGGYHLAAVASDAAATAALRARKHREDKPFAVLAADLEAAAELADIGPAEAALLQSAQSPIVLVPRRADAALAPAVAPGNRRIGLMLPYTPLHHLLVREVGEPIVLTSGNISDEPIAFRDDDASARLAGIADRFLLHDRDIHIRTDDSVARVSRGRPMLLRRSRGYAPTPLRVQWAWPRPVLGCGAEMKSTFCLARDHDAVVSHHIGDLENAETLESYVDGIAHLQSLFAIEPEVVAHDLHPGYLSTQHAAALDGVELVAVQHHHAHIAACLADTGVEGPVIGLACDGLGYGTDGTLWGGEVLVAGLADFARVGHLRPVPLQGGSAAIREPWRVAAAYLERLYGDAVPPLDLLQRQGERWSGSVSALRAGINSPLTSSLGRLFDAAAALAGVREVVRYEGQAAIELEQLADLAETGAYPMAVTGWPLVLDGDELIEALVRDVRAGVAAPVVAARVHNGVIRALVASCVAVRDRCGLATVGLSGGVFQNELLTSRLTDALEAEGMRVLTHERIPPNDGGISFGQAVVAGARDRADSPPLPATAR